MRIGVLGTTIAADDRSAVALGGPKQRALLAALALHRGHAVSVDTLADLVWDGTPPAGAAGTLQGYVAGLRRALEPNRSAREAGTLLVTEQPGYALRLAHDSLDVESFERAVAGAHSAAAPLAAALLQAEPTAPEADAATLMELQATLADAIALWRATPYADLGEAPAVSAERARLEELRLLAQEDRAVIGLLLGRHAPVAAELESLTRQHPLRERLWALRAIALAGSGRQADALATLREVRELLDDELALEPGPELRAVQAAVLHQQTAPPPAAADKVSRATRATPPTRAASPWPFAGRDKELAALTELLDGVMAGNGAGLAALTGEPGIGKTRLASELVAYADGRGARVAIGRCSQDDGAPALWPWATILSQLGAELPTSSTGTDDAAAFRAAQTIVQIVVGAASSPLVVVLDDLHWADTSTLRVLRLLADSVDPSSSLLVVATWREHPAPSGALADVAETFARRHAVRLQLRGLTAPDAAQIVRQVASAEPTTAEAEALTQRTDGNPFFLVEYARLAGEGGGDLRALVDEADPPVAVQEVLTRRLDRLDAPARELLQHASVVGRDFEIDVVAATTDRTENAVLDVLDRALEAGLVTEDGVDRFRFTHALVRDSALASLPQSRRARVHARAATALTGRPGREAEIARHWMSAGPRHVGDAWRAAASAAGAAASVHAYVEALEMLEHALRGQREDSSSTPRDRFEVLADLADVLRRSGRWIELRDVAHEAMAVADEVGDLDLRVRAGVMTSTGALWQPSADGVVDDDMVAYLRTTLDSLPPGDDEGRVLTMLALAGEGYYGSTPQEREALCEQAVAMARRIGEPELLLWTYLHAAIASWRGQTARLRFDLTGEAVRLAEELGDELTRISALTLRAVAAGELGLVDEMATYSAAARADAEEARHLYALLVLDSMDIAWLSMREEFEAVDGLIAHMVGLGQLVSITGSEEAIAGAITMQMLWQGRDDELVAALQSLEDGWLPIGTALTAMLCRTGRVDEARDYFTTRPDAIEQAVAPDIWFSPMAWCMAAETAVHLGEKGLAATAYESLLPLAGRPGCAGSGNAMGPIDIYLAMAAHATGETGLATRHADRAEELCQEWRIPLAAQWVRSERDRWSF